jgi:hypothetical protein
LPTDIHTCSLLLEDPTSHPRPRKDHLFIIFNDQPNQTIHKQASRPTTTPISFITVFFPFPFLSNHASL